MTKRLALFPESTQVTSSPSGEMLIIAECNLTELANRYGTPLYLYDEATLDSALATYRCALSAHYPGRTRMTYAGKAFLCVAIAQWVARNNLWVDCAGEGELAIARTAQVPREQIVVHGVNKSPGDLRAAVVQAGTVVVDNLAELKVLATMRQRHSGVFPLLWLRFRPGLAVDTHSYTQTGQQQSKFGMDEHEFLQAIAFCQEQGLRFQGLHFHLGSQFRDPAPLGAALERALDLANAAGIDADWTLSPGGGWGVAYHEDELPNPPIEMYIRYVAEQIQAGCRRRGMPLPCLHLEPGRSLIARAGVALYRVGVIKTSTGRRWVLLDGGLTDNPRPALYGVRYSALPVREPRRAMEMPTWLAGPICESGDVLIQNLAMPDVQPQELIAVPVSGAYQLSMSSNYNGARRPAVLWLKDGEASLIQAREAVEELTRRDRGLGQSLTARPLSIRLSKYQALGNDYLVINPSEIPGSVPPDLVKALCDRHRGFGADGILLGPFPVCDGDFGLKLFNPDGSEFEKSGNGLRIFARYLWDQGCVGEAGFAVSTPGGQVKCLVHPGARMVTVHMGTISFDSRHIPVAGPPREVLNECLVIDGQSLRYCAATIGNPHCVVLCDRPSAETAHAWGPRIEGEARFPYRTNVQFMQVLDRTNILIEIWERGAGYTLSSGSSSCASAAVAFRLGLCDRQVAVHMPGGVLDITINPDWTVSMTGPVAKVYDGTFSGESIRF